MASLDPAELFGTREEPEERRGGRNLWLATLVGLVLLVAALGLAKYSEFGFTAFVYTLCIAAYPEWKRALARQGRVILLTPIIAATIGIGIATSYGGREGLIVAVLVGCGGIVAWRLVDDWVENTLHDSLAGILTIVWIPFLASFLVLMEQAESNGWARVVIFILAVMGNDTGGLFVGMLFGQHKMAPSISPKKTWEGAAGGLVVAIALASGAAFFLLDGRWWIGSAIGAVSVVGAVFGDLAESALKRDIDIKDMSGVLPGHGGILDRIDSILVAAPAAFVVFALFLGSQ